MLFSTIIPTVLHLIVVVMSAFTLIWEKPRHWIAHNLSEGGKGKGKDFLLEGRLGYAGLCLGATLSCFVPIFIIVEGVLRSDHVISAIISGFEWFARSIGAL